MKGLFNGVYGETAVLVTGHTGFKGSWLTGWLVEMGANVIGFSLPSPPTSPNNFEACKLSDKIIDVRGDIRDYDAVLDVIQTHQPKIIFHMAAQPIVLHSVRQPKLTIDTNAGGTVNVLEAIRATDCVNALVSITTDKVYYNAEWIWGYRETDKLGGSDPYSASKAMAELAISSYRDTYFSPANYAKHGVAIGSVRAGNVIGGGDFADYRLVPDCMRALLAGEPIGIRIPGNVRPWQHVLEPLSGYLWLGVKLLQEGGSFAEAWNFGPLEQKGVTAQAVAEKLIEQWGGGEWTLTDPEGAKIETAMLRLSWDKAATRLDWRPVYAWDEALAEISSWFKAFEAGKDMGGVTRQHIYDYVKQASETGLAWTA